MWVPQLEDFPSFEEPESEPVSYACLRIGKDPRTVLIFAAILAIFVYGMIAAMLGTILPELSERFHLTPTQNGTIATAQALGLMIASLAVGPLLDTRRRQGRPDSRSGVHRGLTVSAAARRVAMAASCSRCSCWEWAAASWSPGPMRWPTAWQANTAQPC